MGKLPLLAATAKETLTCSSHRSLKSGLPPATKAHRAPPGTILPLAQLIERLRVATHPSDACCSHETTFDCESPGSGLAQTFI